MDIIKAKVGDIITTDIRVELYHPTTGIGAHINYMPTMLEPIYEGTELKLTKGDVFTGKNPDINANFNESGKIYISASVMTDKEPDTGDKTVISLYFKILEIGQTTIALTNGKCLLSSGAEIITQPTTTVNSDLEILLPNQNIIKIVSYI